MRPLINIGIFFCILALAPFAHGDETIENRYYPMGIPLGGIGAGYIDILPNGSTGNLVVNNNWAAPISNCQGLSWAVAVSQNGAIVSKSLRAVDGPSIGISQADKAVKNFLYQGCFPGALIQANDPELPIQIQVEAWSPFNPLDIEASSLPVAGFVFEVTNTSEQEVNITLAGAWENIIGTGFLQNPQNKTSTSADSGTDVIHDSSASNARLGNRIQLLSKGKLLGIAGAETYGLRFTTDREMPFDRSANTIGEHVLCFQSQDGDIISALLGFDPENPEIFWSDLGDDGLLRPWENLPETTSTANHQESNAALALTFTLAPGASRKVPCVFAWHMPNMVMREKNLETWYTTFTKSAWEIALQFLSKYEKLRSESAEWFAYIDNSSLPVWLKDAYRDSLQIFITNGVRTRSGAFSLLESPESDGGLGSVTSRLLYQPALLSLFPELARNELLLVRNLQFSNGEIPNFTGNINDSIGISYVPGAQSAKADIACSFVLQLYRNWLWTGDTDTLNDMYQGAQAAIRWCKSLDEDGDGLPPGGAFYPGLSPPEVFIGTADLWMAALEASDRMALAYQDHIFSSDLAKIRPPAEDGLITNLWNGSYFAYGFDFRNPAEPKRIFTAQLLSRWFGSLSGWGTLLPQEMHYANLQTLAAATLGTKAPQIMLTPGSPNEESEIWPYHSLAGLAAPLIVDGWPDQGLEMAKQLVNASKMTPSGPWALPRTCSAQLDNAKGFRSAESLAIASLPYLLAGFSIDIPNHEIQIGPAPTIARKQSRIPLFTPNFWFELETNRDAFSPTQTAILRVVKILDKKKDFSVKRFIWRLPHWVDENSVELTVETPRGKPGVSTISNGHAVCLLPQEIDIQEGDEIRMELAPTMGPRLVLDIGKRRLYNRGVPVHIFPIPGLGPDRFGFRVHNLTNMDRSVRLQLEGEAEMTWYVAQKDDDASEPAMPGAILKLKLPSSLLPPHQRERWTTLWRNIEDLIAIVGSIPSEEKLNARLVKLHGDISEFLSQDIFCSERQVVFSTDSETAKVDESDNRNWQKDEFDKEMRRLEKAVAQLLEDTDLIAVDPRVAALTAGQLLSIRLNTTIEQDLTWKGGDAVVHAEATVPSRLHFDARMDIEPPSGWEVVSDGDLRWEHRTEALPDINAELSWTRQFTIRPNEQIRAGRIPLRIELGGQWHANNGNTGDERLADGPTRYFRVEKTLSVGAAFIRDWLLLGPFPNKGGTGFETYYEPEIGVNLDNEIEGKSWQIYKSTDGYIDLGGFWGSKEESVAYAYAFILSPRYQLAQLHLGATDGVKVFFNRSELFADRLFSSEKPDSVILPVELRDGWNEILLKVTQNKGKWGFFAEITDRQGFSIQGLKWDLKGPNSEDNHSIPPTAEEK